MNRTKVIIGMQAIFLVGVLIFGGGLTYNHAVTPAESTGAVNMLGPILRGAELETGDAARPLIEAQEGALLAFIKQLESGTLPADVERISIPDGQQAARVQAGDREFAVTTAPIAIENLPTTEALAGRAALIKASAAGQVTFGQDHELFIDLYGQYERGVNEQGVVSLTTQDGNGRVDILPAAQARIMGLTTQGAEGRNIVWLDRGLLRRFADGEREQHINAIGGLWRFWVHPEGGPNAVFFPENLPVAEQEFEQWQTPAGIDSIPFSVVPNSVTSNQASFASRVQIVNTKGTRFDVQLGRTVTVLERDAIEEILGVQLPDTVTASAFKTIDVLTNMGPKMNKEDGLLSIWGLSQFPTSENTFNGIPILEGPENELGRRVSTYPSFGALGPDQLVTIKGTDIVTGKDVSVHVFKGHGQQRRKMGVTPARALQVAANWSADTGIFNLLKYNKPRAGVGHINSDWGPQENPFDGDEVNSFNDGPGDKGEPPVGRDSPFTEFEASSEARELNTGESVSLPAISITLEGPAEAINPAAKRNIFVNLADLENAPFVRASSAGVELDTSLQLPVVEEGISVPAPFTVTDGGLVFQSANRPIGAAMAIIEAKAMIDEVVNETELGQLEAMWDSAIAQNTQIATPDAEANIREAANRNIKLVEHTRAELGGLVRYGQQLQGLEGVAGYNVTPVVAQYKDKVVPILFDSESVFGELYQSASSATRAQFDAEVLRRQGCKIIVVNADNDGAIEAALRANDVKTAIGISSSQERAFNHLSVYTLSCPLEKGQITALSLLVMRAKVLWYLTEMGTDVPEPIRRLAIQMLSPVVTGNDGEAAIRLFLANRIIWIIPEATVYYEEGQLEQYLMQTILALRAA